MTTLRTASQQALAFTMRDFASLRDFEAAKAVLHDNLRAALAQQDEATGKSFLQVAPVQEPVAWIQPDHLQKARIAPFLCRVEPTQRCADFVPLYLAPPQRQPLTKEEIDAEWRELDGEVSTMFMRVLRKFARAIERAHGIGAQS